MDVHGFQKDLRLLCQDAVERGDVLEKSWGPWPRR